MRWGQRDTFTSELNLWEISHISIRQSIVSSPLYSVIYSVWSQSITFWACLSQNAGQLFNFSFNSCITEVDSLVSFSNSFCYLICSLIGSFSGADTVFRIYEEVVGLEGWETLSLRCLETALFKTMPLAYKMLCLTHDLTVLSVWEPSLLSGIVESAKSLL